MRGVEEGFGGGQHYLGRCCHSCPEEATHAYTTRVLYSSLVKFLILKKFKFLVCMYYRRVLLEYETDPCYTRS